MGRVIKSVQSPMEIKETEEMSPSMHAAVIELAVEMAKRIVEAEIESNPALLEKIFARALLSARGLEAAEVHVHPLDREAFDIDTAAAAYGFSVRSDESVGRAGCRVIGRYGEIDASMEAMTAAFQTVLKGAR